MRVLVGVMLSLFFLSTVIAAPAPPDPKTLHLPAPTAVTVYYITPSSFDDSTDADWDAFQTGLLEATFNKVIIYDQGFGGDTFILNKTMKIMKQVEKQGKEVDVDIVGPAYSAHAYLVCAADNITMENGGALMFHAAGLELPLFWGFYVVKIPSSVVGGDPSSDAMLYNIEEQCKSKGLLTNDDINAIHNGQQVILTMTDGKLNKVYQPDVNPQLTPMLALELYGSDILSLMFIIICVVGTASFAYNRFKR